MQGFLSSSSGSAFAQRDLGSTFAGMITLYLLLVSQVVFYGGAFSPSRSFWALVAKMPLWLSLLQNFTVTPPLQLSEGR